MSEPSRPLPRPTPDTERFWEGCRAGELRLQRCRACGTVALPPTPTCRRCASDDLEELVASGRARLASFVIHHRPAPGFEAPYAIAIVELAEGPRLMSNLVDVDQTPEALSVGMPLEVAFEDHGDVALPLFRPAPAPDPDPFAGAPPPGVPADPRPEADGPPPRPRDRGAVAIVGAAETTELGKLPTMSPLNLHVDAARNALADCGLATADVDGVACAGISPVELTHALGLSPTWVDGTAVGGCSFMLHVRHAVAAIEAGLATTVLVTHGESGRSRVGGIRWGGPGYLNQQFEMPYGPMGAPTLFTLPVMAWADRYGITEEQLAQVAVVQRAWAAHNPRAYARDPLTTDDVLGSPMIAWPFRKLMCCLVTDGGGALVLTSAERAADLPRPPVHVLGSGESVETPMVSQMEDLTSSRTFRTSTRRALAEAGIGVDDIDHLMAYDAFVHTPLYALEALGVVGPGESAAFVAEGHTAEGGRLPMNTNGGGLSYTHTGMYGMFALQESVRQVRGTAPAQVDGVEVSVAHGVGGMFAASGTVVLARHRG